MSRMPIYSPVLDHMGQRSIRWAMTWHGQKRVLDWYARRGYHVYTLADVAELPSVVVEERVSRLREYWRRWLLGESAVAMVAGPAGMVVGGPVLSFVLVAWAVEMGWSYGIDMESDEELDGIRRRIHQNLMRALGISGEPGPHHGRWIKLAGTVLFWGFGPELSSADTVMAEMRREFRSRWENRKDAL